MGEVQLCPPLGKRGKSALCNFESGASNVHQTCHIGTIHSTRKRQQLAFEIQFEIGMGEFADELLVFLGFEVAGATDECAATAT
jgi:hypothetical protein